MIETMNYIKDEVRKQKSKDRKVKLPELLGNQRNRTEPNLHKMNEKIAFKSLDWEDREKVLRILFSKMNTGKSPSHWRSSFFDKSSLEQSTTNNTKDKEQMLQNTMGSSVEFTKNDESSKL
mmetsp:Transcript_4026/g.3431  ORF Transcript_4026/g.3431 Transcript_4026/m.3431 type:complete len:121 (+) Transcript_4026:739-1101(+)